VRAKNLVLAYWLPSIGGQLLDSSEQAHEIADVISDKRGSDIVVLDIRPVSTIADYFVIATADSERQAKAIIEEIEKRMKARKISPLGVDGEPGSGWVLLDYSDVLVHIFDPGTRDYYQLEELWNNAPTVVRIQ
jgi:ribosome-associated protein